MAAGKRIRLARLAILGAAVLGLAGCTSASEPPHIKGLQRLVSLNPCTDALLVELADPEQIAALSHYSRDPASSSIDMAESARFRAVGGSVEEVLALDPDIVLASDFLAPATRHALRDLGLQTEEFGIASDIAASFGQIRRVAALVGHPDRGEALIAQIEDAVRQAEAAAGDQPVATVLWQPGEIVAGEGALVSRLMRSAGLSSHSAALGLGQADYLPLELIIAQPPELLLIAGDSRAQDHPVLRKLSKTRVEHIDPKLLYCGGSTIIRAAERLSEIRREML